MSETRIYFYRRCLIFLIDEFVCSLKIKIKLPIFKMDLFSIRHFKAFKIQTPIITLNIAILCCYYNSIRYTRLVDKDARGGQTHQVRFKKDIET